MVVFSSHGERRTPRSLGNTELDRLTSIISIATTNPSWHEGALRFARLDPKTQTIAELTAATEGVWDFRASASPDGKQIVFCRTANGTAPSVWVMDSDGANARMITQGINGLGADHPRWIPQP